MPISVALTVASISVASLRASTLTEAEVPLNVALPLNVGLLTLLITVALENVGIAPGSNTLLIVGNVNIKFSITYKTQQPPSCYDSDDGSNANRVVLPPF